MLPKLRNRESEEIAKHIADFLKSGKKITCCAGPNSPTPEPLSKSTKKQNKARAAAQKHPGWKK